MPPSLILEVLKITEAEMDLREQTREVEQVRPGLEAEAYAKRVEPLEKQQSSLADRTDAVIDEIVALDDGATQFAKEIALLERVVEVMDEAMALLKTPETGPVTIAAETEIIELLLMTRRAGAGGGGGGSTPGKSNSGGDTNLSALALAGRGQAEGAKIGPRTVDQTSGKQAREIPDEFRAGLDHYFDELGGQR